MTADDRRYVIMPRHELSDGVMEVRAVQPDDIEAIRLWRNVQMDVLRQTSPISSEEQERYFASHVWPEMNSTEPSQILLSLKRDGILIGYGGLVHISWPNRRAEVSFLLEPELERNTEARGAIFRSFLCLLEELAFKDFRLRRLFTETFAHRTHHITTLEESGFRREGFLREHILIDGKPADSIVHGLLARDWRIYG